MVLRARVYLMANYVASCAHRPLGLGGPALLLVSWDILVSVEEENQSQGNEGKKKKGARGTSEVAN
jgi:hypothetical protein